MESTSIVCKRNCFSSLSKLINLKEDTKTLCNKLEGIAQNSFVHFDSGCHSKRTNPNKVSAIPPKRLRKKQPNTPTR